MSLAEPKVELPKDKVIEIEATPKRNKYTVYGKVNSKGTRYEVTKIIDADTEDIASSIYKERIKKEFSGVRNITCIKATEFRDTDTETIKEIELPKAAEPKVEEGLIELNINGETIQKPKDLNNMEFNYIVSYLISLKKHSLNLYTCYYTDKKKINNSYRKNNLLCYISFNELDAYSDIEKEVKSNGIPYKEKYIHEFKKVDIKTALSNPIIRNRMINNGINKYGSLEKACEKLKDDITLG